MTTTIPRTIAERVRWAEKHIRSKEGRRFTLTGRAWVTEHFWRPANGWRVRANDIDRLCEACKSEAGGVVEAWDWKWVDRQKRHASQLADHAEPEKRCAGLKLVPIICTVLNLPRREGKTFNVAAFVLATIFLSPRRFVLFLATAGEQTKRLFSDNIEAPILQSEDMREACEIVGNTVRVPSTGSRLDVPTTTSHKTITGGGYTHIVLEEARDFDPRTVSAAVLSIRDQGGYECPRDVRHVTRPGVGGEIVREKCPVCGDLLVPWFPRIVIPSSSGIVEDAERDWFNQLVSLLEEDCPANYYVFRTTESNNPVVSKETTSALQEGFGKVESLKTYMDVELNNTPRRKGEDFLTTIDLQRIEDSTVTSLEGSDLQCCAFLDTSSVSDLTTFLVCGWEGEYAWQTLRPLHWKIWRPKITKTRMTEAMVLDHFDRTVPNLPRLEVVLVDDRGSAWAKDLVHTCNTTRRAWGQKIRLFHGRKIVTSSGKIEKQGARIPGVFGGEDDRARGWQQLEERVMNGRRRIVIPPKKVLPELHEELLGVTKVELPGGFIEYRDRNRRVRHADVADALAGCAFLAYILATKQGARLTSAGSAALAALAPAAVIKGYGFGDF